MPINQSNLEGTFTFETGATPAEDDPQFHVLFLGDWAGDGVRSEVGERSPLFVDRDNFDDVMDRLGASLLLDLGDRCLRIEFRELDDFHPDSLFRRLPVFAELRDVRKRLLSADGFADAAAEVRSWFAAPVSAHRDTDVPKVSIDELLSGSASRTEESDLSKLIAQVVEPHLVRIDEQEQLKLVSGVDSAVTALMRSILHHPKFVSFEALWRGLFFAVRRIATDIDLKLFIFDVSKTEIANNLKDVNRLDESVLYREVIRERLETPGAEPFSLICGAYEFSPVVDDIAALMRIGKIASASNSPFVSMIRPTMYGIADFSEMPDPAGFEVDHGSTSGKLWDALRAIPESHFIGLSPMRFLARLPYGNGTDATESFEFEEFDGTAPHSELVWANPTFAVAVLLAQSYGSNGWAMGNSLFHDLDRMPLYYDVRPDGSRVLKPAAESVMTEVVCDRLLDSGLIPLISFRDSDRIRIARFQSVAVPPAALRGRWSE